MEWFEIIVCVLLFLILISIIGAFTYLNDILIFTVKTYGLNPKDRNRYDENSIYDLIKKMENRSSEILSELKSIRKELEILNNIKKSWNIIIYFTNQ